MNWIQQQLGRMPEPDIILHIGAGLCSELPDYQRIQPNQIVLVEPNPETCAELQAQAAGWDNITVLQAAVTNRTGRASLRMFNFPELDSLQEPVGLYNLLPGLRQIGRSEVSTLSACQLIEQLPLEPEGHNWLVLEAPGEELDILTALADCQALERFSRLIVRAGSEAFYNDTPSSSPAVLETLEQLGYASEALADQADADWPRHHLRLDHMALEYKRLQAEHKADLQATAKALDSLKQVLAESERQHQAQLAEAKKAKEEATQAHQAELAKVEESHKSELEALRQQLSEAIKANEEATEAHQSELEATLQKQAQAEKDSTQRIQKLESTLAEQKATSEKLNTELHEREKELATLKDNLTEAEQQVSTLPELQTRLNTQEEETAALKGQLEQLKKKTEEEKQQLEQVTQSRDNLQEQLQKRTEEAHKVKIRVSQLEEENEDYQQRHKLLEEELVKAEAQIELIKQMFLSGDDALDFDDELEKD